MIILEIHNSYTNVLHASVTEDNWLTHIFSHNRTIRGYGGVAKGLETLTMYDPVNRRFPSGLVPLMAEMCRKRGFEIEYRDRRVKPCNSTNEYLRFIKDDLRGTTQMEAIRAAEAYGRGIWWLPTGYGKCLGKGTPVLLYDGRVLPVEQIMEGMLLMGPDSTPRRVLSCTTGVGPLYRIVPKKGPAWVCNDAHILTLVHTETGKITDISVQEYLSKSKDFKHLHKQFSIGVDFPAFRKLPIDPYFVGLWYGDGTKALRGVSISKPDPEIKATCEAIAKQWGLRVHVANAHKCPTYNLVAPRGSKNLLLNSMRSIVSRGTLPKDYLIASRGDRLALLAGLLDTDGYLSRGVFEIAQKEKGIAEGVVFLANTLGFRATIKEKIVAGVSYWRVFIFGDIWKIPTRIPRKQAQPSNRQKDATRVGFTVQALGPGEYFGFTLDGDRRFLLGDCTVTHNTMLAIGIAKRIRTKWAFLVDEATLLEQTRDRWNVWDFDEEPAGILGDGKWQEARFVVATYQSLQSRQSEPEIQRWMGEVGGILLDECHVVSAETRFDTTMRFTNAYYRLGMSATPLVRSPWDNLRVLAATGRVIYRVNVPEMVAAGLLTMPIVKWIDFNHFDPEAATWQGIYNELVVKNVRRNNAVVAAVLEAPKPALVFVRQINHGEDLLHRLSKKGIIAEFLHAEASLRERKEAIARMTKGETQVIVTNKIFQKGVDIPRLMSVIIAGGGKSVVDSLQQVGRGMRLYENKTCLRVFDFMDNGHEWLLRHSRERRKAYRDAGYLFDNEPSGNLPLLLSHGKV